jgi:hypothetical protein
MPDGRQPRSPKQESIGAYGMNHRRWAAVETTDVAFCPLFLGRVPFLAGTARPAWECVCPRPHLPAEGVVYRPRYLNIQRLNYLWTIRHSSARIAGNLIT